MCRIRTRRVRATFEPLVLAQPGGVRIGDAQQGIGGGLAGAAAGNRLVAASVDADGICCGSLPFFVVAVVLGGSEYMVPNARFGEVIRTAGFAERLLGAGGVVWFYLYKALLPLNLLFVYPQWKIEADNLLWWLPLVGGIGRYGGAVVV